LPGLVDSHVHLAFDASEDPVGHLAERDDAAVFAAMACAARAAVRGGVTTVRDLGDRGYLSLGLRDAAPYDPSLPTILAAGPPITSPGGHCHFLGGATTDVVAAVREHASRGVDVIKIMASGGNLTAGSDPEACQFGLPELRLAVEEAHRLGLPVTAHAHGEQAIRDALAAGVDGLEHVSFMTADGVDPVPDDVLKTLVANDVVVGLTLGVRPIEGAVPPPAIASRMPLFAANARRLYEGGVTVVAGTDAGLAPIKPPDALRWAVTQMGQLGMSPAEALRTATVGGALACGLGERKGRIAPGYDADIVAVTGNPLDDLQVLHQIKAVYVRGVPTVRHC
jgi:imidazolonepropionase-like amidohydrolase